MKQHGDFFQLLKGLFLHLYLLIYHLSIYYDLIRTRKKISYKLVDGLYFFSRGIIHYNTTREHEQFFLVLQNWRSCAFEDKRKLTFEYSVKTFTQESVLL